ncbi:MAG: HEAT repeat domain-containing protein [Planctomycetota bacterium]
MDISELIKKLHDPGQRNFARDALIEIGPEAAPALLEALESRFGNLIQSLEKTDLSMEREKILRDPDFQFSFFVSYILKRAGAAEHVILDAIEHSEARVRRASAIALGVLRDVRAVFPLTEALDDSDPTVAVEVAEALRKIGEPAVEGLVEALEKKNSAARVHAAAQLGYIGKSSANPKVRAKLLGALVEALRDGDRTVVETANAALFEVTGQDFEENHNDAVCWVDRDV